MVHHREFYLARQRLSWFDLRVELLGRSWSVDAAGNALDVACLDNERHLFRGMGACVPASFS